MRGERQQGTLGSRPLTGRASQLGWVAAGALALIAAWAAAASRQPELVLPSPVETVRGLIGLVEDGIVASSLAITLTRAAAGVAIALGIGAVWGVVAGLSKRFAAFASPALAALMAVPPVVLVVVGLVWFGAGGSVPLFVVALVATPLIVIAVQEAVRNLDSDLLEMAHAFSLSGRKTLRHLVLPGVASPVLAATSVAIGQSLRVTVMAELLSAANGVGFEVARSRTNLATADLFAWALLLVATVLVIELAMLRPTTRRLLRWRTESAPRGKGT